MLISEEYFKGTTEDNIQLHKFHPHVDWWQSSIHLIMFKMDEAGQNIVRYRNDWLLSHARGNRNGITHRGKYKIQNSNNGSKSRERDKWKSPIQWPKLLASFRTWSKRSVEEAGVLRYFHQKMTKCQSPNERQLLQRNDCLKQSFESTLWAINYTLPAGKSLISCLCCLLWENRKHL